MDKEFQPIVNAEEMNRALARIAERSSEAVAEFLDRQSRDATLADFFDPAQIGDAFQQMTAQILASPVRLVQAQMSLWNNYLQLWQHTARSMMGETPAAPAEGAERWNETELFDFIRQSYLMTARWIQTLLKSNGTLDKNDAHTVDFYTRQFIDGMSAPAFFAANEQLMELTVERYGDNLLKGLDHVLSELERGKSKLARKGDPARLGRDVAATPGKVVFRNRSIELLHYNAAHAKTHKVPLLIIPPWNARHYLLDLTPATSFIKWAVEHCHDVFVLSWAPPEGELAKRDFAETLSEGPQAALDAVEKLTGEPRVNGLGFGLGGTLLAATLGRLAARGENRFASATYLGTLIDFFEVGEISVFANEEILRMLDHKRGKALPATSRALSSMVDMLRANDLIWSFVIDSYLDAATPLPIELLRWNADSLNLATAMQDFYLRSLYQRNLLAVPGGIILQGSPIDLGGITLPTYVQAGREDHIAPWKTSFAATRLFSGPVRFVLSSGGHTGSILSPPQSPRSYWTNPRRAKDPQSWLNQASRQAGSWWEDWARWVTPLSGPMVPARKQAKAVGDAPGSYARQGSDGA